MEYQLQENDVRLMRRILVALNTDNPKDADEITKYLKRKGVPFLAPGEATEEQREQAKAGLPMGEKWLADHYGMCILVDHDMEAVFLNSKWINPYTLYVRLVHPVDELGKLGEKYYIPPQIGPETTFRAQAEKMHKTFLRGLWERVTGVA